MPGKLEAIWIKRAHRCPMDSVENTRVIARSGLEGNVNQGGRRQVTLLSSDAWGEVQRELGQQLDPTLRRANLLITGLDLENSRGKVVLIGAISVLIHGETKPCRRMEQACSGLRERLAEGWRGGVYGEVLEEGVIRIGDAVRWVEDESRPIRVMRS